MPRSLIRPPSPRQRRRGFSLIEAVIAGAILVIGFTAILSATASFMNVIEHDRKLGEAWRLLQAQASVMRGLPDDAAEWSGDTSTTLDRVGNVGGDFALTRKVSVNTPFPPARQMELRLTWPEASGTRSTVLVIHR